MTLTVGHYLRIYEIRKEMMDAGVINPGKNARRSINQLVSCLQDLNPDLVCRVEQVRDVGNSNWYSFSVDDQEIARINFGTDSTDDML